MAIIAYLRVSTDEQANSGLGLEAQLASITEKVGTPDVIYRDEGYSGSDAKRPALLHALDTLKANDVLAIAKRDRLGRDVFLMAWIEKEVKKCGARITSSAGEGTENDDPASVLMRQIVDAFAEYERNIIGARTASAMAQKKIRGEYTGGDVPFGYSLHSDGIHLVEDPVEQAIIATVNDLRAEGYSLRQIAVNLEQRGITRNGQRWHPQTIKNLTRNVA
jgi:site-specific DNA recombinase